MPSKNFYVTTPIYYVNDKPHIGHAYTSLAADVLARFKRLDGYDVHFLTGTDEHGQKVMKAAEKAGKHPKQYVDEFAVHFREMAKIMGFSNNDFIQTTEPRHIKGAQAFWQRIAEKGHIYSGTYAGWYSMRDEAYYQESELVNGKAPTGADVEWVEEKSYFFKLSAFETKLLDYYNDHPDFIAPSSRRNEVISFVKSGLKDLSISRSTFSWGIPVPGEASHVMYVWIDALANYLTALGFPEENAPLYKKFWPADLHLVGKDILRFHAVYWPAMLMAADLPLPKRIMAHGWWTNEGEKISKSLGNVIDPLSLVAEFGLDPVRYFLMREVPFGNDGNYSRQALILRINAELANTIGNLAQRSLSMIYKNCDGKIPPSHNFEAIVDSDFAAKLRQAMDTQQFHAALELIVAQANRANEYIDTKAPWKLKKENPAAMESVLYNLAEAIRLIAIALQPFTPTAAAKILDILHIEPHDRTIAALEKSPTLASGSAIEEPTAAFPRYEEKPHAG